MKVEASSLEDKIELDEVKNEDCWGALRSWD